MQIYLKTCLGNLINQNCHTSQRWGGGVGLELYYLWKAIARNWLIIVKNVNSPFNTYVLVGGGMLAWRQSRQCEWGRSQYPYRRRRRWVVGSKPVSMPPFYYFFLPKSTNFYICIPGLNKVVLFGKCSVRSGEGGLGLAERSTKSITFFGRRTLLPLVFCIVQKYQILTCIRWLAVTLATT